MVRLASHNEDSAGELIVAALVLTTILALPQMLILFCISSLIGGGFSPLGLFRLIALATSGDDPPRINGSHGVPRRLFTDAISYLGQAGLFSLMARSGSSPRKLGLP
jgi:hypothetical protein